MSYRTIVDGGYLSWMYGTRPGTEEEWKRVRGWYSIYNQTIVALDHSTSYRHELDAAYKSRRVERRRLDPAKVETRARVHEFTRRELLNGYQIQTLAWPGLEADDLVALLVTQMLQQPVSVVGVDKDLLQLPFTSINLHRVNDDRVTIENFASRLPRALQPYVRRGRDVLLCLALMGDRSDSVVRLTPRRDFRQMIELLHHPRPFRQASRWFGQLDVGRNVYLTALPGPWVYYPYPTMEQVLDELDDGHWWQTKKVVQPGLQAELERVHEDYQRLRSLRSRKKDPIDDED